VGEEQRRSHRGGRKGRRAWRRRWKLGAKRHRLLPFSFDGQHLFRIFPRRPHRRMGRSMIELSQTKSRPRYEVGIHRSGRREERSSPRPESSFSLARLSCFQILSSSKPNKPKLFLVLLCTLSDRQLGSSEPRGLKDHSWIRGELFALLRVATASFIFSLPPTVSETELTGL